MIVHRKLRIWSYLLKKYFMENFIFCAVHFCIFVKGIESLKGITRFQESKNINNKKAASEVLRLRVILLKCKESHVYLTHTENSCCCCNFDVV